MSTDVVTTPPGVSPEALASVILQGNLKALSPDNKVAYYNAVCASVGLNPLTQPFGYLMLSGKEVLYAKKDATEQLRKIHGVSIYKLEKEIQEGLYVVTAYARDKSGKEDSDVGAVSIQGLKGEMLSNAIMKATTKAKRRVTLSICGLGMLEETEVDSIPGARVVEPSLAPTSPRDVLREVRDEAIAVHEDTGEFCPTKGRLKGRKLRDVSIDELGQYVSGIKDAILRTGKKLEPGDQRTYEIITKHLDERLAEAIPSSQESQASREIIDSGDVPF